MLDILRMSQKRLKLLKFILVIIAVFGTTVLSDPISEKKKTILAGFKPNPMK